MQGCILGIFSSYPLVRWGRGIGFNNRNTHLSFLLLKIVRKFLRAILLRVGKDIILISVGAQKCKFLSFANIAPSVFLNFLFFIKRG